MVLNGIYYKQKICYWSIVYLCIKCKVLYFFKTLCFPAFHIIPKKWNLMPYRCGVQPF